MRGWASAIAVGLLVLPVGEVGAIAGTEPLIAQRDETTNARDRQRALELGRQAMQLYKVDRWQEAVNLWERALAIVRAIGDRIDEGTILNNIGWAYQRQGQYGLVLEQFQQALAIFREVSDRAGEGTTLNNIGAVYDSQGQYGLALQHYQQALAIRREVGDRAGEGTTLNNIGVVYYTQDQYGLALEHYLPSLAILREVGDRAREGTILHSIGLVYARQDQYRLALEHYQQSLVIARELGDRMGEGTILHSIGLVYDKQGQYGLALEHYQQALAIRREVGDRAGEGTTLNNIGVVYSSQGQYGLALEHHQQALAIRHEVGDRAGEGTTLNNIGVVYDNQSQYGLALEQYQQALAIRREVGDRAGEGTTLNNIGSVYKSQGQYGLALEQYQQALAILREVGDRAGEGTMLNNIGTVYDNQGQYGLALEQYQQALTIAREVGDRVGEGATLDNIGAVYDSQGQYGLALEHYQQALTIRQEVGDRAGEGVTLNNIGLVYYSQGQYGLALEQYQQALAISREVGNRAGEGATLNNIGWLYVDTNDLDRAASFFQQSLTVTDAIEREIGQQDRSRIAFFETRSFTYANLTIVLAGQNKNDRALETADRGRARSLAEFLNPSTDDQLREPLNIEQIKKLARDRDATILVYAIVGKEIYIWAVTPAGEIAFHKADPETVGIPIETIASRARSAASSELNNLTFSNDRYQLLLRGGGDDDLWIADPENLKRIYQLLIEPVEAQLPTETGGRVIVVPHRELGTVPFAALLDGRDRFLVDRYAISVTPSLQVLDTVSRQRPAAIGPALVVGNPSPMPTDDDGTALDPLPGAESEAQAIAAALNTTPLLKRQATETAVKQQLATARILHLATHGVLETDDRGIETAWLAFGPDGQNDGKLDLSEVFASNLSAEMVVLSACDTNRGQVTGEGVIGLGRAFLKAGTPTVVASLWKVPDQQTAMLMEAFYQELQQGRDRADALRLAQLKVREQYPNPRYWAAFVLIGEGDRSLDLL